MKNFKIYSNKKFLRGKASVLYIRAIAENSCLQLLHVIIVGVLISWNNKLGWPKRSI
jgi:hypothetical protein